MLCLVCKLTKVSHLIIIANKLLAKYVGLQKAYIWLLCLLKVEYSCKYTTYGWKQTIYNLFCRRQWLTELANWLNECMFNF